MPFVPTPYPEARPPSSTEFDHVKVMCVLHDAHRFQVKREVERIRKANGSSIMVRMCRTVRAAKWECMKEGAEDFMALDNTPLLMDLLSCAGIFSDDPVMLLSEQTLSHYNRKCMQRRARQAEAVEQYYANLTDASRARRR